MAWSIKGQFIEVCSCKMFCPCGFGPAEPDRGWCAAALFFEVENGNSDGIDLGGSKVALAAEFPKDFFSGNGTARLYIDATNERQRDALEAIFSGKRGGGFEALTGLFTKTLPSQQAKIEIQRGDNLSISVGSVGEMKLAPLKNSAGKPTRIVDAEASHMFGADSEDLAFSDGSHWSDPDLRQWEAGGSGGIGSLNMSG